MLSVIIPTDGGRTACRRDPRRPWVPGRRRPGVVARGAAAGPHRQWRDRAGSADVGPAAISCISRDRMPQPLAAGARQARLALADVPACRRRARPWLDRGDHAVHPGASANSGPPGGAGVFRYAPARPMADTGARPTASNSLARLIAGTADRPGAPDRRATIMSGSAAMRRTPAAPRARFVAAARAAPRATLLRSRIVMV